MKIRKVKEYKTRLLKLKLLKTKLYKRKDLFSFVKTNNIEYQLKKALNVIHKYHINNKQILFVGIFLKDYQKLKQIVKNTNHILIPESIWVKGILTNQLSNFSRLFKHQNVSTKRPLESLLRLRKKSSLIVILNQSSNLVVLEEGYIARIPIISLNANLDILNIKPTYKVPGDFGFVNKKTENNFFYSILSSIFEKSKGKKATNNLNFEKPSRT